MQAHVDFPTRMLGSKHITRPSCHAPAAISARRAQIRALGGAGDSDSVNRVTWDKPPVLIVGAGIAGLATALALQKVGIPSKVLETAPALRMRGAAIGLWSNAWRALDVLGVAGELRSEYLKLTRYDEQSRNVFSLQIQEALCLCIQISAEPANLNLVPLVNLVLGLNSIYIACDIGQAPDLDFTTVSCAQDMSSSAWVATPKSRVELCRDTGRVLKSFTFDECEHGSDQEFRGVHRGQLLQVLFEQLPNGTVSFNTPVAHIRHQPGHDTLSVLLNNGQQLEGSMLVGADGMKSIVAQHLGLNTPRYAGYVAYRGVARIPRAANLPRDTIRQIWGQGVRAGLYSINPDECYWYTCFNAAADVPQPATPEECIAEACTSVQGWAWQVEDIIKATPLDCVSRSRIADRWVLGSCGQGLVTLAGDALHPMTPNLGQGGCVALEDAVLLAKAVATSSLQTTADRIPLDWSLRLQAILREYEQQRSIRCLPITVRSNIMGLLLQIPSTAVCTARDLVVEHLFEPIHFLDHTTFDVGTLVR